MNTHRTACNRDCPDACAILVAEENGRAVALRGDPEDPLTRGFLCERTSRFLARQYDPRRFTSPMLRRNGALVPIGWDEALDLAATKLREIRAASGPAAILHYRSGGSLGILKHVVEHFFEVFGPVTIKRGDICSGAGEAAQEMDFGVSESHDLFDLHHSHLILLWGKNPHTSGVHLLPVLREARRRGARIVGIDPVRTKAATLCDEFLMPRPGSDFELALAIARRLFERDAIDARAPSYCEGFEAFRALAFESTLEERAAQCDLDPHEVSRIADLYAELSPGSILVGWGLARRRNGAQAVRALDALGAIRGNLGVRGGGVSYYFGRRKAFDLDFVQGAKIAPRTLAEARLGPEILAAKDPPVRLMWVTAGNPVSMLPDSAAVREAIASREFTVVVDTHPTDTTDVADLVLPTLTLLEDDDLLGAFGNHFLRASRPAVAPPAGARHELEIFDALADRLQLDAFPRMSIEDWKRRLTRRLAERGITLEEMRERGVRNPFAKEVLFEGRRFPTPSGKACLVTRQKIATPSVDPAFPMTLLACSTPKAQSSQWSVPPPPGPPEVRVHPSAAGALADGDEALLESAKASLRVIVRRDERIRPDIALMEKGGMLREGRCANLLIEAVETDLGGGAAYYDQPVRLRK